MVYVNQGKYSNMMFGQAGVLSAKAASNRNCEFCTSAGVGNLVLGHSAYTSADAARFAGLPDTAPEVRGITLQSERIKRFGSHATGRGAGYTGDAEIPYDQMATFMRRNPDSTVFAVYISGPLFGESVNRSHWLNAVIHNDDVTFFDFQTNRDPSTSNSKVMYGFVFKGGGNASSCKGPFVGIVSQAGADSVTDLHSNDPDRQQGMLDTSKTKGVVIAFPTLPF
jgi:hypothetical protein